MEVAPLQRSAVVAVEGVLVELLFKADNRALAALGRVYVNVGLVVIEILCRIEDSLFAAILYKVEVAVFVVLYNNFTAEIYVRRLGKSRVAVNAAAFRRFVIRDGHRVERVIGRAQCAEVDRAALVVCLVAGKRQRESFELAVVACIDTAAVAECGIIEEL